MYRSAAPSIASVQLPLSTITATAAPTEAAPAATASRGPAAVSIEGVSKTFRLPHQQYSTLKERALHPFRSTDYDELHAVKDVTLGDRHRGVLRDRRAQRQR